MASPLNLTARLNLALSQSALATVQQQVGQAFKSVRVSVPIELTGAGISGIQGAGTALQQASARAAELASRMGAVTTGTTAAASSLGNLSVSLSAARARTEGLAAATGQAATTTARFDRDVSRLGQRLAGLGTVYSLSTSLTLAFGSSLRGAFREAISFERGLASLAQVARATAGEIRDVSTTIGQISTRLGVSSAGLNAAAVKLAQAGAAGKDLQAALEGVAKASLDPSFKSMDDVVTGSAAAMRAFGLQGREVERVLSSVKAVSKDFGVEASGLLDALRTSGAAVKSLGGNFRELLALFAAARSGSGLAAEAIANNLPQLLSRLERGSTVASLRALGVELQRTRQEAKELGDASLEGTFIGPLAAVQRLGAALKDLRATDPRVEGIAEAVGGLRNVKNLLPLLQNTETAQQALTRATFSGSEVSLSAAQAQDALLVKGRQLQEQLLALGRTVAESAGFRGFAGFLLDAAKGATRLAEVLTPLLPIVQGLAVAKLALSFRDLGSAALTSTRAQLGRAGFASGGVVPGSGNTDSVPAMLTPGEFVIRKDSARKIGYERLHSINTQASAGGSSYLVEPQAATRSSGGTHWGEGYADGGQVRYARAAVPRSGYVGMFNLSPSATITPAEVVVPSAEAGLQSRQYRIITQYGLPVDETKRYVEAAKQDYAAKVAAGEEPKIAPAYLNRYGSVNDKTKRAAFVDQYLQNTINLRRRSQPGGGPRTLPYDGVAVPLTAYGISQSGQGQALSIIDSSLHNALTSAANQLLGMFPLGPQSVSGSNIQSVIDKTFTSQGKGRFFEAIVQLIRGKTVRSANADFDINPPSPKGVQQLFGSPASIWADVKLNDNISARKSVALKAIRKWGLKYDPSQAVETTTLDDLLAANATGGRSPSIADSKRNFFNRLTSSIGGNFSFTPQLEQQLQPFFAKKADGGGIGGDGKVPAMLMPGEFVFGKEAASRLGLSQLRHMNENGEVPGYAAGGMVQHFEVGSRYPVKPLLPKTVSNALVGHSLEKAYQRFRRTKVGAMLEKQGLADDVVHKEIIQAAPRFNPRFTTLTPTSKETPFDLDDVRSGHPRVIQHFTYIVTRRAVTTGVRTLQKLGYEKRVTDLGEDWVYDPISRLSSDSAPARNKGGRPSRTSEQRAAQYALVSRVEQLLGQVDPRTGRTYSISKALQLAGADFGPERFRQLKKEKLAAGFANGGLVQHFVRGGKVLEEDIRDNLFGRNFPAILARVKGSKYGRLLGDEAESIAQTIALRRAETFNPSKVRAEKGSDEFPFGPEDARTPNDRLDPVYRGYSYRSIRRALHQRVQQLNRERTGAVGSDEGQFDPSSRLDARSRAATGGRPRLTDDPARFASITSFVRQIQDLQGQGMTEAEALAATPFEGKTVKSGTYANWQSIVETGQSYNERAKVRRAEEALGLRSPRSAARGTGTASLAQAAVVGPVESPTGGPFDYPSQVSLLGNTGPATFSAIAAPPGALPPAPPTAPPGDGSPPPPPSGGGSPTPPGGNPPRAVVTQRVQADLVRQRVDSRLRDPLYSDPAVADSIPLEPTSPRARPINRQLPDYIARLSARTRAGSYELAEDYPDPEIHTVPRPPRRTYRLESAEAEAERLAAQDVVAPRRLRRRYGTADEALAAQAFERGAALDAVGQVKNVADSRQFRSTTLAGAAGGDAGPVTDAELFRVKREFIEAHKRQILALDRNLTVAQAEERAHLAYDQALDQGAKVLVARNGKIAGLESTGRELRAAGKDEGGLGGVGLFGRRLGERAAAVGGTALFLGGSFLPQFSGSAFGHIDASKSDSANATAVTGEGVAGALTGASTGAAVGLVLGPWGAAVGAAAGGLLGFTSSLRDAEGKVAQLKFDRVSEDAQKNFRVLSSSAEFSGERLQRAGVDVTKLIAEGKKEGDRRSKEAAGFFGSVTLDEFQKNRKLGVDKALAPVLGEIGSISSRLVEQLAREQDKRPGGTNAARVFETFAAGNGAAIEALKTTGQTTEELRRHFTQLAQATLRNIRGQEAASSSATDLANRLFNFGAVAQAFTQANDSLNPLRQRSKALSNLFEGNLAAPAADLPGASELKLGLPEGSGFAGRVSQITGGLGGAGEEIRRQAASADVLARVLPDVLRSNAGRGLGGERFGPAVTEQLRGLGVSGEHVTEVSRQIEQLSGRDPAGFIGKLARGSNAEAEQLARNVVKPIEDVLEAAARGIKEQANLLVANLALAAENRRKLIADEDHYGELWVSVLKNNAVRAAEAAGEGRVGGAAGLGRAGLPRAPFTRGRDEDRRRAREGRARVHADERAARIAGRHHNPTGFNAVPRRVPAGERGLARGRRAAQENRGRGRGRGAAGRGGRPINPIDFLSVEDVNQPFFARQAKLGAVAGLNAEQSLDPDALLQRFREVLAQIGPATTRRDQAAGTPEFQKAATALQSLHEQAVYLKDAMKGLTDHTRQNAIIQEKLSRIQADKDNRLSLGERLLSGGPGEILRASQGAGLAAIAGKQGNLNNFNFDQVRTLFDFLNSTANIHLKGLGGVTGKDFKEQLIRNSAPGIANLAPEDQGGEEDLKAAFDNNLNRALAAQNAFIEAQKKIAEEQAKSNLGVNDAHGAFLKNLGGLHQTFLNNLHKALTASEVTARTTELGQLEAQRHGLQERNSQAGFLQNAGVRSDAVLGRLRSADNRKAVDDYVAVALRDRSFQEQQSAGFKKLRESGYNLKLGDEFRKGDIDETLYPFLRRSASPEGVERLRGVLKEKFGVSDEKEGTDIAKETLQPTIRGNFADIHNSPIPKNRRRLE